MVIALTGEILEGDFPPKKLKLVEAWMTLHEDELLADWQLLVEGEGYFHSVRTNGYSVEWANGQDLCPDELYYTSVPASVENYETDCSANHEMRVAGNFKGYKVSE
ncbi:MAG: DUF4160 domain-containing protein [Clostridiales bacterium]|nr:DUF4160 domain-containing protein [Clostridiales bacterium]